MVMGSLLREMEQIKGLPFRETIETQLELAAVYGYIYVSIYCCIEHDKKGFAPPCFLFDPYPQFWVSILVLMLGICGG